MNNIQNIKNTITEHMKTLPHNVQEAIHASSWERKILDIGRKYGLHVDQLEILQTELSLAVLGLSGRDEFVRETMHEARIDKQTMDRIVDDINREIFEPIRSHLRAATEREQQVQNRDEELETKTGLVAHEEETLRRHGVSFDMDEDQTPPQKEMVAPAETPKPETLILSKTLSKPLRVETNAPKPVSNTISFSDIIQESEESEEDVAEEPVKNPFEIQIDPNKLPSAQTEQNQGVVAGSRKTFYEKGDPYREPIV